MLELCVGSACNAICKLKGDHWLNIASTLSTAKGIKLPLVSPSCLVASCLWEWVDLPSVFSRSVGSDFLSLLRVPT